MAPAAAHVFVDDPEDPVLGDDDRHHLERVLRLRVGEAVTASDGRGRWRLCRYAGAGRLDPEDAVLIADRPEPPLTVAFALTKGDRPEWTVQKLTEAGVDRIVPMVTARTVVRWEGGKSSRQVDRLRAVVRSAAMQSRRVWLPVVNDLQPFAAIAAELSARAALAHAGGGPPTLARPATLVGPEGGWSPEELGCGLPQVGLGPTILRSETAAMAAGLLLAALRAGVVQPQGLP